MQDGADSFLYFVSAMTCAPQPQPPPQMPMSYLGLPHGGYAPQPHMQRYDMSEVDLLEKGAAFLQSLQRTQMPISPISTPATPGPSLPSLASSTHTNTSQRASPVSDASSVRSDRSSKRGDYSLSASSSGIHKVRSAAPGGRRRAATMSVTLPSQQGAALVPSQGGDAHSSQGTLSALVVRAIEASSTRHCTATQIYDWIRAFNPDMRNCTTSSVTLQLSHNKAFVKVSGTRGSEPVYTLRKSRSPRNSPLKTSQHSSPASSVFTTPTTNRHVTPHGVPPTPCSDLAAQFASHTIGSSAASPADGPSFYIPLASPVSDEHAKKLKLSPPPSLVNTPRGSSTLSPSLDGASSNASCVNSDDDALPSDFSFLSTACIPPLLSLGGL